MLAKTFRRCPVPSNVGDRSMDVKDQRKNQSICFSRNKMKTICQMNSQNLKFNFKVSQNITSNSAKMILLFLWGD